MKIAIVRNKKIVDYSDEVIVFWDGESKGTKNTIDYCKKTGKAYRIVFVEKDQLFAYVYKWSLKQYFYCENIFV